MTNEKLDELERLLADGTTARPWKHIPGRRFVFVTSPECHVPDQPAAYDVPREDYLAAQYSTMRAIARAALRETV